MSDSATTSSTHFKILVKFSIHNPYKENSFRSSPQFNSCKIKLSYIVHIVVLLRIKGKEGKKFRKRKHFIENEAGEDTTVLVALAMLVLLATRLWLQQCLVVVEERA
ncbi:hypothetical protein Adt_49272 [Abeliophyllum distichum]|uniref:Transmembrane protein n=1 Tax=Abeliophyllum distichum TaxID=126358 RepID=A0ABD1NNP2_9LAMI